MGQRDFQIGLSIRPRANAEPCGTAAATEFRQQSRVVQTLSNGQSPAEQRFFLTVRSGGMGVLCRPNEVLQGPIPLFAVFIMVGDKTVEFGQAGRVKFLNGRRDQAVQFLPALQEQTVVCHLLRQRVLEEAGVFGKDGAVVNELQIP